MTFDEWTDRKQASGDGTSKGAGAARSENRHLTFDEWTNQKQDREDVRNLFQDADTWLRSVSRDQHFGTPSTSEQASRTGQLNSLQRRLNDIRSWFGDADARTAEGWNVGNVLDSLRDVEERMEQARYYLSGKYQEDATQTQYSQAQAEAQADAQGFVMQQALNEIRAGAGMDSATHGRELVRQSLGLPSVLGRETGLPEIFVGSRAAAEAARHPDPLRAAKDSAAADVDARLTDMARQADDENATQRMNNYLASVTPRDFLAELDALEEERKQTRQELGPLTQDSIRELNAGRTGALTPEAAAELERRQAPAREALAELDAREEDIRREQTAYEDRNAWMNLPQVERDYQWRRMTEEERESQLWALDDERAALLEDATTLRQKNRDYYSDVPEMNDGEYALKSQREAEAEEKQARADAIAAELERLGYQSPGFWARQGRTLKGAAEQYGGMMAGVARVLSDTIGREQDERRQGEEKLRQELPSGLWGMILQSNLENPASGTAGGDLLIRQMQTLSGEDVPALVEASDRLTESGARDISAAQAGLPKWEKLVLQAEAASAQMSIDAVAGAGNVIIPMMLRSFGGAAEDARRKGYSVTQQVELGVLNAATEYFTEKLFGGNPYVKDLSGNVDAGLVNRGAAILAEWLAGSRAAKQLTQMLASVPVEMLNEGLEEIAAGLLDPLWEHLVAGESLDYNWAEILDEGIIGAIMGGFGVGSHAALQTVRQVAGLTTQMETADVGKRLREIKLDPRKLINLAAQAQSTEAQRTAEELRGKLTRGQQLTDTDLGQLYRLISDEDQRQLTEQGRRLREFGGDEAEQREVVETLVEIGMERADGTESRRLAEDAREKLDAGETLTDTELGTLYLATAEAVQAEETVQEDGQETPQGTGQEARTIDAETSEAETIATQTRAEENAAELEGEPVTGMDGGQLILRYTDSITRGIPEDERDMGFAKALLDLYDDHTDARVYLREMLRAYDAGVEGVEEENAPLTGTAATSPALESAYIRGQAWAQRAEAAAGGEAGNVAGEKVTPEAIPEANSGANSQTYVNLNGQEEAENGSALQERVQEENPGAEVQAGETEGQSAGDQSVHRRGRRNDAVAPGRRGGGVRGQAEGKGARVQRQRAQREKAVAQIHAVYGIQSIAETDTQSQGLARGTDRKTMRVIPYEIWNEEMRSISAEARKHGARVIFFLGSMEFQGRNGKTFLARGAFSESENGPRIWVQADNLKASMTQIWNHELLHLLAARNPNLVEDLKNQIRRTYDSEQLDRMLDAYAEKYSDTGLSHAAVLEEVLADAYAGIDVFEDLTVYQGADAFGETVRTTVSESEERGVSQVRGPPEEAAAAGKNENAATKDGAKHSIETAPNGMKYVKADRQVIRGNNPRSWGEQVEKYINGKIRKGEDVQLLTEDGDTLLLTLDTAGKIASPYREGRTLSEDEYERKLRAGTHIDELAQISTKGNTRNDKNARHGKFASKGWNYRTAFFQDFDGEYYKVQISVAQGESGNVVYNVGSMKKEAPPQRMMRKSNSSAQAEVLGREAPNNNVAQIEEKVNAEFSRAEDEAEIYRRQNEKLREQVEYWKNQTKVTEERELRPDDVHKVMSQLIRNYGAQLSAEERAEIETALRGVGNGVRYGQLSLGTAKDLIAVEVAGPLVRAARALSNSETVSQYEEVRKRLLDPMTLGTDFVPKVVPRSEWSAYRKSIRRFVNVSINGKGTPVDVRYQELSQKNPELFPESITHPADQLKQMVEVAQTLAPVYENPYDHYMAEAIEYAANDALTRISNEDVSVVPLTYADQQLSNRRKAEEKLRKRIDDLQRQVAEGRTPTKGRRMTLEQVRQLLAQRIRDYSSGVELNQIDRPLLEIANAVRYGQMSEDVALKRIYNEITFPMISNARVLVNEEATVQGAPPIYENPYAELPELTGEAEYDFAAAMETDEVLKSAADGAAWELLQAISDTEVQAKPLTGADKAQWMILRNNAKYEQQLRKVRANRDEKIRAIRQDYIDAARYRAERRNRSEANEKLLRLIRRLRNRKMPQVSRAYLDSIVGDIDTFTVSLLGKNFRQLDKLADSYEENVRNNPNYIRDARIEEKIKGLERRHVEELTPEEMADLLEVLSAFEHKLINDRKLIDQQDRRDAYAMGQQIIEDVEGTKGGKPGSRVSWAVRNALSPVRMARRLTGWNDSDPLYQATVSLADGQRKMLDYQRRAWSAFDTWARDREFNRRVAGADAEAVELRGWRSVTSDRKSGKVTADEEVTLRITPAMRMSLYLHSLNPQNQRHMRDGGVTVPDFDLYRKGRLVEAFDRAETVKLLPADIDKLVRGMSAKERAFAEAARKYFNGMSKDALNETSLRLLGYEIAMVEEYFPIETNKDFMRSVEWGKMANDGTIEGMGSLQERVTGANNPIMLRDLTDVLLTAIEQHSRYYGLAIPVRNYNKLMGVITGSQTEDGGWNANENSVLNAIRRKWGGEDVQYLKKMVTDLQSGRRGDGIGGFLDKIRSNYAGGVLELNAGVAIKQAASYPTAGAVLSAGSLSKGLARFLATGGRAANTEIIDTYTPLLWNRSLSLRERSLADMPKREAQMPKALQWITGMDVATTTALWLAAEYEVEALHPELAKGTVEEIRKGESPFYRAVGELYNRVIEETQPNYTAMQRPQALRSDNAIMQALNMFKTQPFQNFNILYDALGNYAAKRRAWTVTQNEETRAALNEARTGAARAIASQLASAFVFALMQYGWDRFRDKDKKYKDKNEEDSVAAWLKGMGINVASNAAGMLPLGGVAFEAIAEVVDTVAKSLGNDAVFDLYGSGLDISIFGSITSAGEAGLGMLESLVTAIRETLAAMNGDEGAKVDGEDLARKLYTAAEAWATANGKPVQNIRKLLEAIAGQVIRGTAKAGGNEYLGQYFAQRIYYTLGSQKWQSAVYPILYKAFRDDRQQYRELRARMVEDGLDGDKLDSMLKSRRTSEAADGYKAMYAALKAGNTEAWWEMYDSLSADLAELGVSGQDIVDRMRSKYSEEVKAAEKDGTVPPKLTAGVQGILGLRDAYSEAEKKEKSFSADDLDSEHYQRYNSQVQQYQESYSKMLQRSGAFGKLDAAGKDKVLELAESLAKSQALEANSGGRYQTDTEWMLWALGGDKYGVDESEAILFKRAHDQSKAEKDRDGKTISGSKQANTLQLAETWMPGLTTRELAYLMAMYWQTDSRGNDLDEALLELKKSKWK